MQRKKNLAALLATLCVAVVLVLVAFFWEELACRYHLHRVQRDEGYLETLYEFRRSPSVQTAVDELFKERASAIAWLTVVVKRGQGAERIDAIRRLGALGAPEAIPTLSTVLSERDRDYDTLVSATLALVDCGPEAMPTLSHFLHMCESGGKVYSVVGEISEQRPETALGILKEFLRHRRPAVRSSAVEQLGSLGPAAAGAAPDLLVCLKDTSQWVRSESATALGRLRVVTKEIVSGLCHAATERDLDVSGLASEALAALGPEAARMSIPFLRELLRQTDHDTVEKAADACALLDPFVAAELLDDLVVCLEVPNSDVRYSILRAISVAGADAQAAVPSLVKLLDDRVADGVMTTLAAIGPGAVPALQSALDDERESVRVNATQTLGKIGREAKQTSPDLRQLVAKDPSSRVRTEAALALGYIGADPESCILQLVAALEDSESTVRGSAVAGLGLFGNPALPALRQALAHRDKRVRLIAVTTLGGFGPHAEAAVPELTRVVEAEPDSLTQNLAIVSLGKIGPPAAPAVPTLLELCEHGDHHTRSWVFNALGNIGSAAESAIPTLTTALDDHSDLARKAAQKALRKIHRSMQSR